MHIAHLRRTLLGLFAITFLFASLCATRAAEAEKVVQKKLLLWKVESDTATIYLQGSIHLGARDFYPLDPAILSAWAQSQALAVEVDITDTSTQDARQAQMLAVQRMGFANGESLKDYVPAETLETFQRFCKENDLPYDTFLLARPWFTEMQLVQWLGTNAGYDAGYGIDMFFVRNAKAKKRPIRNLESMMLQIGILSGQPMKAQAESLQYTIETLASGEAEADFKELVLAWRNGDEATMTALIDKSKEVSPAANAFLEKILYQRNEGMAEKIAGYLKEDKTLFVVVGAAHLTGEKSVQDYLLKLNPDLKITRIAPANKEEVMPVPDHADEAIDESDEDTEDEDVVRDAA